MTATAVALGICVGVSCLSYSDYASDRSTARTIDPAVIVVIVLVMSGMLSLLTEAIRDKSGSLEAFLSTLPLSRRNVMVLIWGPTIGLIVAIGILAIIPIWTALLGLNFLPGSALNVIAAASAFGIFLGFIPLSISYLAFRGARWDAVRYPVALLIWLAFVGAVVVASVQTLTSANLVAQNVLLLPRLLADATNTRSFDPVASVESYVLGVLGIVAFSAVLGTRKSSLRKAQTGIVWSRRLAPHRGVGELIYLLRDPSTIANLVAGILVSCAIVTIVWWLPAAVRPQVLAGACVAVSLFSTVAVRPMRGMFPLKYPTQQLIGMSAASWVVSQNIIGTLVSFVAATPGILLLTIPGTVSTHTAAELFCGLCVSLVLAIGSGWAFPIAKDDAMGQAVASTIASVVTLSLLASLVSLENSEPVASSIASIVVLGFTILLTAGVERRRWRNKTPAVMSGPIERTASL